MHCNICDKALSEKEIVWNSDLGAIPGTGAYEPCTTCLEVAFDAAFSEGFVRGDEEVSEDLGPVDEPFGDRDPDVEILEPDDDFSSPDQYNLRFGSDYE